MTKPQISLPIAHPIAVALPTRRRPTVLGALLWTVLALLTLALSAVVVVLIVLNDPQWRGP